MALRLLGVLALCVLVASCGGGSDPHSSGRSASTATPTSPSSALNVVALGDSETAGNGDPSGAGWVERYARLLRTRLSVDAEVSNLAADGKTSAELLTELRSDANTREMVKGADIVLLGIGGADLNAGDDALKAGRCRAEACYTPVLKTFGRNFDAIAAEVRKLRGSEKTLLRSITQPNVIPGAEDVIPLASGLSNEGMRRIGLYQARTANRAICRGMTKHGGRCIDVLLAINGPSGKADGYEAGLLNHEDCCYPNAKGQQLMAELLLKTGLAPVRR